MSQKKEGLADYNSMREDFLKEEKQKGKNLNKITNLPGIHLHPKRSPTD